MPSRRIRAGGGLSTDPSAMDQPEGLRFADNALFHRPGAMQPRFGLGDLTGVAARSVARRPIALVAHRGELFAQSLDGSTYSIERCGTTDVYTTDATPPDTTIRGVSDFARARDSLYFTTDDGIKKLTDPSTIAVDMAGVSTKFHTLTATLTAVLASASADIDRYAIKDDGAAAYRYVWRRTDANGYVRRSAPSSRFVIAASAGSGGPWNANFSRLSLGTGIVAGDYLELYRTEGVTPRMATPGREYLLTLEYQVTAADVAAGYIAAGNLFDDTPDSALGAELYTNPSQGGIDQSNEVPPMANALAWWGDVMWYGNSQSRHALEVELVNIGSALAPGNRPRTGFVSHALNGSFTNGSAAITAIVGVSSGKLYGLKVGQYISDNSNGPTQAGASIKALTTLTSITTSIVIDNATLAVNDTITVFGETFTWKSPAVASTEITIGATSILSAGNLATKLDGWNFGDLENVSASNGGTATVTATEAIYGLCVVADVTGTGQTVTYAATMSQTASATNVLNFRSHDFVTINSVNFYAGTSTNGLYGVGAGNSQYRVFQASNSSGDFNSRAATTLDSMSHAINAYTIEQDATFGILAYRDVETTNPYSDNAGDSYLTLIRSTPALGTFTFSCTVRPDAFRPNPGTAGSITSETTRARGRLHWSKPGEPEAVPTLNFFDVGRRDIDILAIVPLVDALLVFKEDGIYSVSGSAPDSWIVNTIDPSIRLLSAQAVCVLSGVAYAWTDRGVVAVTEAGTRLLSAQIGDQLRELQRLLQADDVNTRRAFWAIAHPRHGLVIFGLGDAANDTVTANWYVFHTTTGRWARWPIASRCAAYDQNTDSMVHSPFIDAWSVLYERQDEDAAASYRDASLSALTGTVAGATVTIAISAFGGFTPAAGDVIADATTSRRVESVSSGGGNYTINVASSGLSGVSFTWHQGISVLLQWQAQELPGIGSRWGEFHLHLPVNASAYVSTWPLLVGGQTDISDIDGVTAAMTPSSLPSRIMRVGPPRTLVRAGHLYPAIISANAGVFWQLAGIDLDYLPQMQRVGVR